MQNTTSQTMEGLWIDLDILTDSNLSLQEKFTLAIIRALDKNNGCFASNKYFAQLLQVAFPNEQVILFNHSLPRIT